MQVSRHQVFTNYFEIYYKLPFEYELTKDVKALTYLVGLGVYHSVLELVCRRYDVHTKTLIRSIHLTHSHSSRQVCLHSVQNPNFQTTAVELMFLILQKTMRCMFYAKLDCFVFVLGHQLGNSEVHCSRPFMQ